IDYTLSEENGKWGVEDVSIERVSMVNQYRGTFNNFLTNHTFDEMMKKLRSKLGSP
ncbi:MAG: MlaC protein, partial [Pseudomonadota bacterium]